MVVEHELVQKIDQFVIELEQSDIKPNRLIINKLYLDILKKKFPAMIDGDFFISPKAGRVGIITTDEDYIGLGLAYDEFNIIRYNKNLVN